MFSCVPPIASGYRVRRKNTTLEDFRPLTNNIHPRQMQFDIKKSLGRTTCVATNLRSYFSLVIDHECRDSDGYQSHGRYYHNYTSACNCHSHHGSCWVDSEATHIFRAKSAQFDTGTKSFCEPTHPSASQLISVIKKGVKTLSFAITITSSRHPRIRFPYTSNAPRIRSPSRLEIFGTSQHMGRHPGKSQMIASA